MRPKRLGRLKISIRWQGKTDTLYAGSLLMLVLVRIVISNHICDIVTTQKCKEAGMNHILPKPMDNQILKELVEKYKRPSALMKAAQP